MFDKLPESLLLPVKSKDTNNCIGSCRGINLHQLSLILSVKKINHFLRRKSFNSASSSSSHFLAIDDLCFKRIQPTPSITQCHLEGQRETQPMNTILGAFNLHVWTVYNLVFFRSIDSHAREKSFRKLVIFSALHHKSDLHVH